MAGVARPSLAFYLRPSSGSWGWVRRGMVGMFKNWEILSKPPVTVREHDPFAAQALTALGLWTQTCRD
jgi:hypothetical protein